MSGLTNEGASTTGCAIAPIEGGEQQLNADAGTLHMKNAQCSAYHALSIAVCVLGRYCGLLSHSFLKSGVLSQQHISHIGTANHSQWASVALSVTKRSSELNLMWILKY